MQSAETVLDVLRSLESRMIGNDQVRFGPGAAGKGPDQVPRQRPTGACAARRLVVSPAQPGGTRREVLGSDGLPGSER